MKTVVIIPITQIMGHKEVSNCTSSQIKHWSQDQHLGSLAPESTLVTTTHYCLLGWCTERPSNGTYMLRSLEVGELTTGFLHDKAGLERQEEFQHADMVGEEIVEPSVRGGNCGGFGA